MTCKFLKPIALILALVTLSSLLISCKDTNGTVLQADGVRIDETAYRYWYIQLKDYYVDTYADLEDTVPFWNSEMPDMNVTYGEYIDNKIRTQIQYYLAGNVLFERYGLELSSSVINSIDTDIDDGINSFGSRAQYDAYLEERYAVNSRELRKIKVMEQKFMALYNHLYDSEKGIEKATNEEIALFYKENYARIKYYMILKNYEYVYDKDGNRVVDSNNRYQMVELSDEKKAEKKTHAEEVLAAVSGGENIDTYIKKYYSDLAKAYPNGYYVLKNDNYIAMFTPTLINAAFSLELNGVIVVENEDAYFVVQRLGLIDNAYLGTDKAQFDSIASDAVESKFIKKFEGIIDTVVIDEALFEKYSVITVR